MEKYRFTAQECNSTGVPGYMVTQSREDGSIATAGWVPADSYEEFCAAIGEVPEMVE